MNDGMVEVRYVMLSPKLVQILKTHIATNPTGKYVFTNQDTQEAIE
jgi:hypothetical protein